MKIILIPFCIQSMSRKTRRGARSVFKYMSTPSPKSDTLIGRMRIGITSTMALGALCILTMNQPAQATLIESASPSFHLVRGGARGGGRGFENRGEEDRGNEGRSNENAETNSSAGAADHPATAEDRMHTLDNTDNNRANNLKNDEAGWGEDGGWVDTNGLCSNGATPDAFGHCPSTSQ